MFIFLPIPKRKENFVVNMKNNIPLFAFMIINPVLLSTLMSQLDFDELLFINNVCCLD